MESKKALVQCDVFKHLTNDQLNRIAALCSPEVFEGGETIFRQGNMAEKLYVLVEGKVALQMGVPIERMELHKQMTVDVIREGELFGWSSIVEPYIYTLSAMCIQTSAVLSIDAQKLSSMLHEDSSMGFEVFQRLNQVIGSRLRDTRRLLVMERSLA